MSKLRSLATPLLGLAFCLFATGALAAQETAPANGVPAHLLVTVEPHKGHEVPAISKDDVLVYQGHDRDTVTEWIPAQGDRAGLEVFILLDDASTSSLGVQLNDIRQFINEQPETTKIGVAYMQDGIARVVQAPTTDHAAAAKSLRLPLGQIGVNASPYFSLSDLVKRWPASNDRREVFMVTDGIDRYYGLGDLNDPYLQEAIDDADRAGIIVSALYNPDVGHFGHSYWQTYWGQLYLSELADKTGGEAYYIGMTGAPVAFAPYLQEFEQRTQHQYFLTFLAKPPKKAGWVEVRLRSEVPNVDLVSSRRVYVSPEGK
jgi:hypothetical protein